MATRDELLALADRCEREEPSRELDGEIMFSLFAVPVGKNGYLWPEDDPSWAFAMRFPGKDAAWFKANSDPQRETILIWREGDPILLNHMRIKPVTSSLDAAVTLVPESAGAYCAGKAATAVGHCFASVDNEECWAKTPALALCAAALRARAAMEAA